MAAMLYLLPVAHLQQACWSPKSRACLPLLPPTAAVHAFMPSTALHFALLVSADAPLAQQTVALQGPPIGQHALLQF